MRHYLSNWNKRVKKLLYKDKCYLYLKKIICKISHLYNNSHSKSKSINKSNSIIRIIDENKKQFPINKNINNINKLKIDIATNINKNKEGLQTERINNNFKTNTIPKISFDVNINNNININKMNEYKTTINNKSYFKGMDQKKKNELKSLHINFKKGYTNRKIPQSFRNRNNINRI